METIAVALSGGADSLLSLLLLRDAGKDVMGVHAHFLPPSEQELALTDAIASTCHSHGIAFQAIDLHREFEANVIAPFLDGYRRGLTPNPCALCNPTMKFGLLLEKVRTLGATTLATGHYTRLENTPHGPALFRGLDPVKDQSYFLSLVPQRRFAHVCFPLGARTKKDVLAELSTRGIAAPAGGESQEICFIPDDYRAFLKERNTPLSGPGPIALTDGTVLGKHQGIWNHTLGQRKGLGVAYSEPLYVIAKDRSRNRIVVGPRDQAFTTTCQTKAPIIHLAPEAWPSKVLVQTIYRQQPAPAQVAVTKDSMHIRFDAPHSLPSPGQIAAVYSVEGRILAGAIIDETGGGTHAA